MSALPMQLPHVRKADRPRISHIRAYDGAKNALCGARLRNVPASGSEPCVVCLALAQGNRFIDR